MARKGTLIVSSGTALPHQVVTPKGEIDLDTAPTLREQLLDAVLDGPGDIVVDLAEVSFMDSTAIAVLINMRKRLASDGRSLILRSPTQNVRRVLDLCCLDGVLTIEDGEEER